MHGNLPVIGMRHLLIHLGGYFGIVDCLDFYGRPIHTKLACDVPFLLGLDFEVH